MIANAKKIAMMDPKYPIPTPSPLMRPRLFGVLTDGRRVS
jgi:hypothetical protein